MTVSNEAVEAGAREMFRRLHRPAYDGWWETLSVEWRDRYRADARAAIEAAAPYMMGAAWSTCSVESARCGLLSAADALLLANRNPYRNEA